MNFIFCVVVVVIRLAICVVGIVVFVYLIDAVCTVADVGTTVTCFVIFIIVCEWYMHGNGYIFQCVCGWH